MTDQSVVIGFGGGCHWCTEAVFTQLCGVSEVKQGFISSSPPADEFSEAVLLTYQRHVIPIEVLLEIHLRTHARTSQHSFRAKYRSAVYTYSEAQSVQIRQVLQNLQHKFTKPLVTEVLPISEFRFSDERYHQFYKRRVSDAFCTRYIDPKLDLLKSKFSHHIAGS